MSASPAAEPLRIAHLTATFPPYPGGAGNTCYRFAKGQAERGHHVEVFTAPAEGEPPDPGAAIVHRLRAPDRDRQRTAVARAWRDSRDSTSSTSTIRSSSARS